MSRNRRRRGSRAINGLRDGASRDDELRDEFEDGAKPRPTRRIKRWKRRLVVLLVLLVAAVAAAPTIVGRTVLRNTLLVRALPAGWQIESERADLGWLSNQSLTGLVITDEAGKTLLTVESVTVPRALLSLAVDRADLGKIELVRPTAYVETRADGSNWEDFVAALQAMQQQPSAAPVLLSVEVVDGVVRGLDTTTGEQWLLDRADLVATIGESIEATGSVELTTDQSDERGKLKFRWQPEQTGQQQIEVLAERLPLRPLQPWLARAAPGTQLAGVLSTDARVTWQSDDTRGLMLQTSGRLEASQLEVVTPALAGDRLRSGQINAPWEIGVVGDEVQINQLRVDADWVKIEAAGTLSLAELRTLSVEALLAGQLPKRNARLAGNLDLAALAAMLPSTLQLREGVRIDEGRLTFDIAGSSADQQFAWQTNARIENVAGSDGQRQVRWQQPIELQATLRDTATGVRLESLVVDAPFAQANVTTEQAAITGDVQVDLAKFAAELSQFVDLQSWQLRGLGEGTFSIARGANEQFEATADIQLTDLRVADANVEVWTEPKLTVSASAAGTQRDFRPTALATSKLQLRGPQDQLEVVLLQPAQLDATGAPIHLQVEGNGPLQLWAARLRPWLAIVPVRLEGDAHARAHVVLFETGLQVVESTGSVVQFLLQNEKLSIDEPRVEFAGTGSFDWQSRNLQMDEMQLLGSSLSCRARGIEVALDAGGKPIARGNVAFRGDLQRIATMMGSAAQPTTTWPKGTAVGQVQLATNAEQVQADFGVKIEQLQLVRATAAAGAVYGQPEVVWSEPMIETTGVAKYLLADDRVQLDNLRVRGQTLQLSSSATIDRVSTVGALNANGLIEYAPEQLTNLIASYAGPEVQLVGDRQVRFQVAGPLFGTAQATTNWSHAWEVTAEAGWTSAGAFGLPLGGGRLKAALRDGQLQIAPLDVAVGEGRFTAEPFVRLTPGAEQLLLKPGPLVTDVAISPAVSEKMLKYVAPILAGATRAEGEFSITLDQAEVPLTRPEQSRVQGKWMTHRLAVSPGPMTNQLITLVKQIEALSQRKQFLQAVAQPKTKTFLTMTEQQVDFQVAEGRVYHRNLEFLIDDAPVRSYGSVGFDQTLALVIEVPIQDEWIESEPALRGFRGQTLKLPIYGTFQKPRIDERAVADLSRQLLQGAATQAIGDELNRQFEKLFGR